MHPTAKVSEGTNRNVPARNTLVQLLALYTNPESQNAQRHRQTDRQTDRQQDYANSRSYCVTVRSAKKLLKVLVKTQALFLNFCQYSPTVSQYC